MKHLKSIAMIGTILFCTGFSSPLFLPPPALTPMVGKNKPVDWFFAFKFNSASFPNCDNEPVAGAEGRFGGQFMDYPQGRSQQYLLASSAHPILVKHGNCIGATDDDPLGTTFGQVYLTHDFYYVVWNDQFYNDPQEFGQYRSAPWAHSKGMLAWDSNGDGFVLQVTTPSWPASGSRAYPRETDGNTLGCIKDDNIKVSQHFFCLKLNKDDVVKVLTACINASVVTDPTNRQVVRNGGPAEIQKVVKKLGKVSNSKEVYMATLSSSVQIISKPHNIVAPPWQLVSAKLNSLPIRVASWWERNLICSTDKNTKITCWENEWGKPGPVTIVTQGTWQNVKIGLVGGNAKTGNHAKFGVSTDNIKPYSIFGDMNQEGALNPTPECNLSQNPRGGLFYVVNNKDLHESLSSLLTGDDAGTHDCSKPNF